VPSSEVRFASLGNDPERYKALLGGIALATVISIEFLPIGKTDGIKLVARGSEVMPKYLRLCAVTTGKLLDARREDAVRFLAAQMQGYNYAPASRRAIRGRSSCSRKPRVRTPASIPACRFRWTSSNGCSSSWSRPETCRSRST
jgi:hypothetical protein